MELTTMENLQVTITSFSFKKGGIPADDSGNGGGFVFDCRSIHNPGRYEPYKRLTGRDLPVIQFLESKTDVSSFLQSVFDLVDRTVKQYQERGFTRLMVNFGCTGGQHRSVYCADRLAAHLKDRFTLDIRLHHVIQEAKNWEN